MLKAVPSSPVFNGHVRYATLHNVLQDGSVSQAALESQYREEQGGSSVFHFQGSLPIIQTTS